MTNLGPIALKRPEPLDVIEDRVEVAEDVRLAYWETGRPGEAVVLCHAFTGNLRSWANQQAAFAGCGYRVIGYSRRGHFGSDPGSATDSGTQAGDLRRLLDALGIERAHVVGIAAGGSTALDFVLSHPDRTLSAVVASSLMSIDEPEVKACLDRVLTNSFRELPHEMKELSASFRCFYPDAVEEWKRIEALNSAHVPALPLQPLNSKVNWKTLSANKVPMLLMTGGADLYMPPQLLRSVAEHVGQSELQIIPDAGHALPLEATETFNALVLGFMGRNGG